MSNIITWNNRIIDFTNASPTPSFSPLDYSPIAWFDSSDVATITKDISNKVSQWNDKSGLGYHLVQGTDLNKPTYSATDGIVFDGVDDYMNKSFATTYNQPITIFIIWKQIDISVGDIAFDNYSTNYFSIATLNNAIFYYAGGTICQYSKTTPFSTPIITTAIFNTSSSSIYENNSIKTTNSNNAGTNTLNGITLGRWYGGTISNQWNGNIKEIIIYNSALSVEQITIVNNYLSSKYSISI